MDTSLWSAGYRTHLKIVAVSLVASIAVVLVAINAPVNASLDRQATVASDQPATTIVKAGASKHYSENTQSRIR